MGLRMAALGSRDKNESIMVWGLRGVYIRTGNLTLRGFGLVDDETRFSSIMAHNADGTVSAGILFNEKIQFVGAFVQKAVNKAFRLMIKSIMLPDG